MKTSIKVLFFILYLFIIDGLYAQPGSLDKSFGDNGMVTTKIGPKDNVIYSIIIQDDQKIVVAGYVFNGSYYDFALARYDTSGKLDQSFGINGIVINSIGRGDNVALSLMLQPDGKLVASGYAYNGSFYDFALVRYNSDGSLDQQFGLNGITITSFGSTSMISSSILENDGKIISVGYENSSFPMDHSVWAMCRYNSDGTLDETFGSGGKVITEYNNSDDVSYSVALRKNGEILVTGYTYIAFNPKIVTAEYKPDGSLDPAFGEGGKVITSIGLASATISMSIQEDEKIIVTGCSYEGSKANILLLRYNSDGTLDNSFGTNGLVLTSIGSFDSFGRTVKLESDKKILVSGFTRDINSKYGPALLRYLEDGKLDTTFGTNGIVTDDTNEAFLSLAIQKDGRIIAAGSLNLNDTISYFAINRYLSGINLGITDPKTTNLASLVYPNPFREKVSLKYTLPSSALVTIQLIDANGKVIKTYTDNQSQSGGTHLEVLDLHDAILDSPYYIILSTLKSQDCLKIIKY